MKTMQHRILQWAVFSLMLVVAGCGKDKEDVVIDDTKPEINIAFADAFPVQCSEVQRGQKFRFKARLSDNVELGNVSVDIHHNFDHHTHSTEIEECTLAPKKSPVKPFLFIKSCPIPKGLKSYETDIEIDVPSDIDPGDYHFMIIVTDQEGWSDTMGLSIKIK